MCILIHTYINPCIHIVYNNIHIGYRTKHSTCEWSESERARYNNISNWGCVSQFVPLVAYICICAFVWWWWACVNYYTIYFRHTVHQSKTKCTVASSGTKKQMLWNAHNMNRREFIMRNSWIIETEARNLIRFKFLNIMPYLIVVRFSYW